MDILPKIEPPAPRPRQAFRPLWRLVGWGSLAAMAVTGAALITLTDHGAQRLQLAFAPQTGTRDVAQVETPQPSGLAAKSIVTETVTKETEALRQETLRLRAEVRELASDRDRLNVRVAGLERSLNDMTGSIRRELSLIASTAPKIPPPAIEPPETVAPRSPAEVASAGDAKAKPADVGQKQDKSQVHFDSHGDNKPQADKKPQAHVEAKTEQPAAGPIVQSVPLPPVRVASAPAQAGKPEIGIELGGARSMEIVNARWVAVKANFGPYIDGMHPLVVHDARPGINIPYRLIVGPLPNGAAAAQLCQRFAAAHVTCRTTRFAGEPLAEP